MAIALLAISLASGLALTGCSSCANDGSHMPGYTDETFKTTEEVSADTMNQFGKLIGNSDTDGLVAAFSENARANDKDLQAQTKKLMSLLGNGTVNPDKACMSVGSLRTNAIYVAAMGTVTTPDGSKWMVEVTNCTLNTDDASELGFKTIEVAPYVKKPPHGFSWISNLDSDEYYGIRLIETWDGYDPRFDW